MIRLFLAAALLWAVAAVTYPAYLRRPPADFPGAPGATHHFS